ncbi:MAG: hypothetical protein Q7U08_05570 [Flavobacteriaceae bacterium]|nr:hypothetical protein [Flavobacteriaceae bacterium]
MKTLVKNTLSEGKQKLHLFVFKNFKSASWNEKRRFSNRNSFLFS